MEKKKRTMPQIPQIFATVVFTLLGLVVGWLVMDLICGGFKIDFPVVKQVPNLYKTLSCAGVGLAFGLVGFLTAKPVSLGMYSLYKKLEKFLSKYSARVILMGVIGLIFGLIITVAINLLFIVRIQQTAIEVVITAVLGVVLCFLGMLIGANFFSHVITAPATNVTKPSVAANSTATYIVESSALIDGRILDIIRTGFVYGRVVVPDFILKEVSAIADSQDMLKKNRGRRGLDILAEMKKEKGIVVDIIENDTYEASTDTKLLKLAEVLGAPIITVDFNLNKLAAVKNIMILNVNELSSAIKPITLPGEKMTIKIVKEGKEQGQGLGYLEDGTMIVVENGQSAIGMTVEVTVTTAYQTAAGRMVFARI